MRVDLTRKLFGGVRIDGRMREQLEKCPQRDRVFFEAADSRYLTVLRGGDDTYIGKILDPAVALNSIDDIRRNIWSILQRICPGRRDEGEVKLFAIDDADVEPTFSSPSRPRVYPSHMGEDREGRAGETGYDSRSPAGLERHRKTDEDDYY